MVNPFVHVELNTTDLPAAKSFYGSLFTWTLSDVAMGPAGNYTMINVGEGTGGFGEARTRPFRPSDPL